MDKKYLVRVLVLNTIWVIWIALSIFFGCLIANAYFPDNNAMFIPFSLIFLVFGIGFSGRRDNLLIKLPLPLLTELLKAVRIMQIQTLHRTPP